MAINVVAPPPQVNDAQVVGISVPARMVVGQEYNVSATMRNAGTKTWSAGTLHRLGLYSDANLWNWGRAELAASVAPGQQYTFNFRIRAPAAGTYDLPLRMLQENIEWFGTTGNTRVTVTENLGNVTFIHTDGLGSPVARTDAAGQVIAGSRTRYEPYGYVASGATPTIGFTGHVNDVDTGLTYMQQRYYDPVAGRFLSIDPVVTDANTGGSFNRYAYAINSPYRYTDPDGRDARDDQIADDRKRIRDNFCNGQCGGVTAPTSTSENTGLSGFARSTATEITSRGYIEGKNEADLLYVTNSDPDLSVTVDASKLTVTALGDWQRDPKGGLRAPGYVNGMAYWVHGQVTIRARPDGTYGIYDQRYHYEMHFDFSPRGIERNIATFLGEPPTLWPLLNGTPFTIRYSGNANLSK